MVYVQGGMHKAEREREIERENIVSYCHFWVILLQCVVVQICTGQKIIVFPPITAIKSLLQMEGKVAY